MARCPSRLYKRMFLSSRLRCVMSCVSHVSEGKDSVTSSNFFCSEPWREREGGAEGHPIHLHSERETNLTISVLSRSRVRHLGCPNGFATPQGAACPACVCAFRSSVKSEVGVTGRVRTRHISPRQSPSHYARAAAPGPAQAAGGTRPAARGPSFSPLAHLLRPPSSRRAVPPACLSDIRLPPILYRKSARERECRDEDGDIGMPVQRFHTPQQPSLPPGPPCAPLTRALSNMLVVCICQPALPPSLPSPLLHSHYIFRARRAYRCDSQNSP